VRGVCKRYDSMELSLTHARWNRTVPEWEEYTHTPGVFVRVASKGVTSGQYTCIEV
jgi:hypothetical protein